MSDTNEPTTDPATTDPAGAAPDKGAEPDWKAEAEKWKSLARKHEERAKDNATAAEELAKLREAAMSDQEKAVAAARDEGRKSAVAEMSERLARLELKAVAKDRLPAGLLDAIDIKRFITDDGDADTAAIAKFVEDNAVKADTGKPPVPDFGGGKRGADPTPALNDSQLVKDLKAKLGAS